MDAFDLLNKSGIVGYLLLTLSIISLAIVFEKLMILRLSRIVPKSEVKLIVDFLSNGNVGDAIEVCKRNKNPFSEIIIDTLRNIGDMRKENFLNAFEVTAKRKMMELERGLPFLATIAAVAPLLGLTGTVLGMMKIFGVLNAGATTISNPQQLSGGIAEALLTTVFGLFVAIPTIVMFNVFQRKLDKIASEVESAGILIANNFKGLK